MLGHADVHTHTFGSPSDSIFGPGESTECRIREQRNWIVARDVPVLPRLSGKSGSSFKHALTERFPGRL